ncbi:MAG: amidophosphoribosyltransferase [Bacteroidales bacterium]|nr:amidophosphoribosyltransferase [Bacteroidales bacterium]
MSDQIKHECGVVLLRLLKPISYYQEKYGTPLYGLNKLYLMMEKQHNRGQEGAGLACVKIDSKPGTEYIFRQRALGNTAISECFENVSKEIEVAKKERRIDTADMVGSGTGGYVQDLPYIGEVYIGHLRYSTTGRSGMSYVHPFLRRNNWRNRNLCLAGNFNITNEKELFASMVQGQGQHPRSDADTFLILEQMGALLDEHHSDLYRKFKKEGLAGEELNAKIEDNIDMEGIISEASRSWDGGFCIVGSTGSGESFVFRDRWGIRPCFYYIDDEIIVAASERAAIQTALDVKYDKVQVLQPGEAITIHKDGKFNISCLVKPENPRPCSFERIYFSRGSDADIYRERKMLGKLLIPQILDVCPDLDKTVFSFIPNTAEVAFMGMLEGLNEHLNELKLKKISQMLSDAEFEEFETLCRKDFDDTDLSEVSPSDLSSRIKEILAHKVRSEKLAIKDIKMRTFIAEGSTRNDLAAHVYDITYNSIEAGVDSIAVIDDSIVRGTTLKQSIIKILSRLEPREIVIISSSPQIRYPDCYGIDMSRMGEFIAFNAAVALLKERGMEKVLSEVYRKCKEAEKRPLEEYTSTSVGRKGKKGKALSASCDGGDGVLNYVKEIYAPFTDEEISFKIAQMVTPAELEGKIPVRVVFQSIANLHKACPGNSGDWYFSGDYPTPGGTRTAIQAYINWYEGNPYKRGYSR